MTAGPNDLCTVSGVQAYLSLPSGQDADLIQTLVTAASTFIQTFIGYNIAASSYTETRNGNGRATLITNFRPIISIQSLTIGNTAQVPSSGFGERGYTFDANGIYMVCGEFCPGNRNINISYTAGYAAVPADLSQACVEMVALRYSLKNKTGYVTESGLQQTTTYSQKDMPVSAASVIAAYRRVFLP